MRKTLILSRAELEAIATMPMALNAVEFAFRAMAEGTAEMPPKVYLSLPEHDGDFRAMPARLGDTVGLKWVNSHPRNPERHGLPSVLGLYVLSDPATALPLAIMDGTSLTALRTGAAAGVASRALARRESSSLGLVGAGVQAEYFLRAHREVFPELSVSVSDIDDARAREFAKRHGVNAVSTEESAGSDVVCIATPSRTPVLTHDMIKPGTHINAMGADAPGKQELESAILEHARVFVDELEQARHSGEINVPLHAGTYSVDAIAGTVGEVIAGQKSARTSDQDITVFDSTGLAVQDLALASRVFEAAGERGVRLDLVGLER
ncbi:MAG: ornithine cyclodeaminase family protein [Myxococcota bacterium]